MKTPIYRRVTYISFIIIFLVVSPLVILYTMGYRYNFTKGRVQKTGILKITSVPRGASIKLNGQLYATSLTPAKIEYLLPGDYEISLSKDGYYDWQKKLAVYENGTTFAEKINLWKKTNAQSLSTSTTDGWLISPDQNLVAMNSGNAVMLMDINSGLFGELSGGKIESLGEIKNQGSIAIKYDSIKLDSFSPTGRYILITTSKSKQTNYYILDTISKEFKQLSGKDYKDIRWDSSSDTLYALNADGLWQFNLTSLTPKIVLKKTGVDDFYVNGKTLYTINNQILIQQSLTGESAKELKKVTCQECQIREIKNNKAFIIDTIKNNLSIIDTTGEIKTIDLGFKNLSWLNGNSMIIYNDFEIYIYETNKTEPELITRLSTPIKYAIWHPQGRHLIFSTDNEIKIIELDNRELRNIISIAKANSPFLVSDRAGQNIFYAVDKLGIFKLNIQ